MRWLWCLLLCCFISLGVARAQAQPPVEEFLEDVELEELPVVVRIGAALPHGADAEILRKGYELFSEVSGASEWQIEWLDGSSSPMRFDFVSMEGGGVKRDHYEKVVQLLEGEKVDFLMGSLARYACGEAGLAAARKVINVQCCTAPVGEFNCDLPGFWMRAPETDVVGPAVRSMVLRGMQKLGLLYDGKNVRSKSMCASTVLKLVRELGDVDDGLELMVEEQLDASNNRKDVIDKFARDCKDKEVEAVVACCEKEDCSHVLHALHQIKYPLKATFLMDGPVDTAWLSKFPPKHIRDIMTSAVWHERAKLSTESFGSLRKFRLMYKNYFNTTEEPRHDTASAFSAGLVLATALKKAMATCSLAHGSVSTHQLLYNSSSLSCLDGYEQNGYERILETLSKIEIETFDGPIKFNWRGRNLKKSRMTVQIRKRAGTAETLMPLIPEVVLPLEYATANMKIPASNPYRQNCSAGYYMSEDEFDPCIKCPPGMISRTINAHHCDSCTLTEWMDQPGAKKCNQCPPNTRVSERGATKLTDCLCQESYFHPLSEPGQECFPCVSGSWCPGGIEPPIPLKGFWADQLEKSWVHACKQRESCLGGKYSECAEGYSGRLCAECQAGFFQFVDQCWKCKSNFTIICFIIILILGWYILNVVISRNVSSLDMLLGFAQMVNIIGDVNLNWPKMLSSVIGIANLLDFDVDILEPTCLFPGWSFSHNLIVQLTLPLLMGSMAHFGYLASWAVLRLQKGKGPHVRLWIARVFPWIVSIPENEEQLKEKWDSTIAAYLAAVDITFVTVTKYTYEAFQCEKIGGKMVMTADSNTECGTTAHKAAMAFASIGILIYTVGYMSFIIWKLLTMWSRKSFSEPHNLRRYGFLYRRFEPDYFWMSIMILIRRVGFVCALVFISSPAYQAGGLALIINASLMLHVYTAPYVDTYLDVLFSFLLVALMFVTFGGVMFYSDHLSTGERDLLEWLTLAVFSAIVLVFLVIFANEVIRMYKIHALKKLHLDFVMSNMSVSEEDSEAPGMSRNHAKKRAKSQVSHELLETFDPDFLHRALIGSHSNAQNWNHLTNLLKDYMSDQSETSYLSMKQVAKFWRKLVDRFPELVDFLALADDNSRAHFREFANCLYVDFFLKKKLDDPNIFDVLNWRDRAPLAQWLAHCGKHDRAFFTTFMGNMIRQAEGEEKYAMYLQRMQSCGRHLPVKTPYLHAKPRSRRGPNSSGDSKRFPLSLSEFLVYVSSRDPEAIEEEIRNGNGPLFHSASTRSNSLHHDERKCSQSLSKEIP